MARPIGFSSSVLAVCIWFAMDTNATDLGTLGKRYSFAEDDYYEVLMAQVRQAQASGEFDRRIKEQEHRMKNYLTRPQGVQLPAAQVPGVHFVDPTYQISQDITDGQGKVLYPAGFTFNPLHYMSWDKHFCLIDGDSAQQVAWAKRECRQVSRDRIVLVNGSFFEVQKQVGRQIYFDQYGKITERFVVRELPSLVYQQGDLIRVETHVAQ